MAETTAQAHAQAMGPQHAHAPRRRGAALRWAMGMVLAVAALACGLSWVLASPVGGSPDDDFHLGSIWCPRPVASSGCATRVREGEVQVQVPERVADTARCLAFHEEIAANCQGGLSDEEKTFSRRYDDGNYPTGYYRFHHQLVGEDVDESALAMRGVNLLISVVLLGGIGWLLPARMRQRYALAIILAWMPMGIYLVASNNPSSWALTGVLAYAAGMYGSLRSQGPRRWALLGLALLGALLACVSRGDSAFYLLVVSLAIFVGIRWRRRVLAHAAIAAVISAVGAWMMLRSGQSQAVASAETSSMMPDSTRLKLIILTVPEYFGGFFGSARWGAGWFDVPLDGPIAVLALGLAGIAMFIGARTLDWRKVLSAGVMAGALIGLPIVLSYTQGFESTYDLQPRYLLPLLAPFFLIWLRQVRGAAAMTASQAVLIVGLSTMAHAYSLHRILLRYTHGLISYGKDDAGWLPINLSFQPKWWWDIPVGPMAVWALGSVTYGVAITCALLLTRVPGTPEAASAVTEAPPRPDGGRPSQAAPEAGDRRSRVEAGGQGAGAAASGAQDRRPTAPSASSSSQARVVPSDDEASDLAGGAGGGRGRAGSVLAPEERGPWVNMPDAEPQRVVDAEAVPVSPVTASADPASSAACAALAAG